jgi:hypothetical protein
MKINKKCSHCGNSAGRFEQYWNQDRGFGICPDCIDWLESRGENISKLHGKEGIHYERQETHSQN